MRTASTKIRQSWREKRYVKLVLPFFDVGIALPKFKCPKKE